MQNAIDFQELRRQERRRIRSSKKKSSPSDSSATVGVGTGVNAKSELDNSNLHSLSPSSKQDSYPSTAYETLLPQNELSKEIYRIRTPTMIDSVFYSQNFLSSIQEREIMSWLQSIPEYSHHESRRSVPVGSQNEREESREHNGKWTRLEHARRKVALFDATICIFPHVLQRLSKTLVAIGAFPSSHPPNHVLINEYNPGEGIMPHTDGPAYESRTATISLGGSDVIFKLWPRENHDYRDSQSTCIQPVTELQPSLEVILHGKGSLVLFTDDAYLNHCHEICEGVLEEMTSSNGICGNDIKGGTKVTRGYRVSLTFRCKKGS
mmetsp:Transcript_29491/g.62145  ORF Transcript_29491/g.62145 Transcript_29491/m.62145 type:complete len:322 (+) Transcript_29491:112-1077(+)